MSAIAYVNGAYVALNAARISVLDRGFQFGDAVYEVWAVRDGRMADAAGHMARLHRSLSELRIAEPMSEAALGLVLRETIRRNKVRHGIVYLQVSRGAAPRDHAFPSGPVAPTVVVTAKSLDRRVIERRCEEGVRVITTPEIRWSRRDIKSVNLLPNVLMRQKAKEAGAFEAWFVDSAGYVTEGTSSNAWIVDKEGSLRTRALSNDILHGVTRAALLELARDRQIKVAETPFTPDEAKSAREAFITSASNPAVSVIALDGAVIGDGKPGPVAKALRDAYLLGA